jgi:hypothetical protein
MYVCKEDAFWLLRLLESRIWRRRLCGVGRMYPAAGQEQHTVNCVLLLQARNDPSFAVCS